MKKILFILFLFASSFLKAQKIDSIYVNLYTDSLKKGTYNYINIDGRLANGRYLPLDSTQLIFSSSAGKFYGNNLFIEHDTREKKINIHVTMRDNKAMTKDFVMYIKTKEDDQHLPTAEELMNDMKKRKKKD